MKDPRLDMQIHHTRTATPICWCIETTSLGCVLIQGSGCRNCQFLHNRRCMLYSDAFQDFILWISLDCSIFVHLVPFRLTFLFHAIAEPMSSWNPRGGQLMSWPRLRQQVAVGQRLNGVIVIPSVGCDGAELHLPERLIYSISRKEMQI